MALAIAAALAGCAGADAPPSDSSSLTAATIPIKHVVVIVKENHTFDNYFGSFPGAAGTSVCQTSRGPIACPHAPDSTSRRMMSTLYRPG